MSYHANDTLPLAFYKCCHVDYETLVICKSFIFLLLFIFSFHRQFWTLSNHGKWLLLIEPRAQYHSMFTAAAVLLFSLLYYFILLYLTCFVRLRNANLKIRSKKKSSIFSDFCISRILKINIVLLIMKNFQIVFLLNVNHNFRCQYIAINQVYLSFHTISS